MGTRLPGFSGPSRNRTKSKLHLINSSLSLLVSLAGATAIVYFNLHSLMHKYVALLLWESVHVDLDYSKLQKYFRKMTLEAKLKWYDWYAPASTRTVPGQDPKRSLIEIMKRKLCPCHYSDSLRSECVFKQPWSATMFSTWLAIRVWEASQQSQAN